MSIEQGEAPPRRLTLDRSAIWPLAIAVGLALVVLVNALFIYIAVKGADDVAPSYVQGNR
ncbi:MAG: hypothetical protein LJF04_16175 [Gemmatimonadetes bacterium]|nr:hypothetical protein [Gemmatimonadota bacterium]